MLRTVALGLLTALPLGIAGPAGAQAPPAPSPPAAPTATPVATERALLALGLVVTDVQYEPGGTDGTVAVSLSGPPDPAVPDRIAEVVWASEPLRFSDLVVRWPTGHVDRTYVDLQTALGPRPAGYDQVNVLLALLLGSGAWARGFEDFGRFVALAIIVAVVVVTVVVLLFVALILGFVVQRRRRLTTAT